VSFNSKDTLRAISLRTLISLFTVISLLAAFIALPESLNPLAKIIEYFGVFSGYREPWAKFEFIFFVIFHALLAFVAQNLLVMNFGKRDHFQDIISRSSHSKKVSKRNRSILLRELSHLKLGRVTLAMIGCLVCLMPAVSYVEKSFTRISVVSPPLVNNFESGRTLLLEIERTRNSIVASKENLELCIHSDSKARVQAISQILMMSLGGEKGPKTSKELKIIQCSPDNKKFRDFIRLREY